jgi:hypothetical protein
MAFPQIKIARPRRRDGKMPEAHWQRCVDYYVMTHSARALAEMLVDLEWSEGCAPPIDEDE